MSSRALEAKMDLKKMPFNQSLEHALVAKLGPQVKVFDSCSGKFVSWIPESGSAGGIITPIFRGACGG